MSERRRSARVAVVGPCAAGKSTVVAALRRAGWDAHQPAQEHSGVPDMWRRLTRPDVTVYLDASLATIKAHRPDLELDEAGLSRLNERLALARAHAHLVHCVDGEDQQATTAIVAEFLARWAVGPD